MKKNKKTNLTKMRKARVVIRVVTNTDTEATVKRVAKEVKATREVKVGEVHKTPKMQTITTTTVCIRPISLITFEVFLLINLDVNVNVNVHVSRGNGQKGGFFQHGGGRPGIEGGHGGKGEGGHGGKGEGGHGLGEPEESSEEKSTEEASSEQTE